ncbi:T7SS effector LXG polymorphic toxin [Listeria kieliensis]
MARIDIVEVKQMCDAFQREADQMEEALNGLKHDVNKLIDDHDLQGKMAENAKTYYEKVILMLVKKGKSLLKEAKKKAHQYVSDFHNQVDPSGDARLDTERLYEMEAQIANYQYMMETVLVEMKAVGGIDALPQQFKQLDQYASAMSTIHNKMDILHKFEDFEARNQDVLEEALKDMYYVKQGLEDIRNGRFFKGKSHSYQYNSKITWLSHLKEKDKQVKADYDWDSFEKYQDNHGFWVLSKEGMSYEESMRVSAIYNGLIANGKLKDPSQIEKERGEELTKVMTDTIWAAWANQLRDGSGKDLDEVQKMSITVGSAIGLGTLLWTGRIGGKGVKIKAGELANLKSAKKKLSGKTYSINKPKSVVESQLIRDYIRDVEARTGRSIPKNQVDLLKEALRTKEYTKLTPRESRANRYEFNKVKVELKKEWELKTGQKWPVYKNDIYSANTGKVLKKAGEPYDAHHVIENSFGGDSAWWNIHPARYPNEHQAGIHAAGSPARKLFKGD